MTPKINDTGLDKSFITETLISKSLSAADYNLTHQAMLARTLERIALKKEQGQRTPDELWIVEHNDVYTLGQAGKEAHILRYIDTPIIKTDRGGQVTWHGQGQLVLYWLFDLHSLGWSVRQLVSHAEQALEDVLNACLNPDALSNNTIMARARREAPGVYLYRHYNDTDTENHTIMLGKIASLGFKIKHGFSYHGLALNINCDLSAFNAINPCGYAGMQMLRLADFIALHETEPQTEDTPHNLRFSYEQVTQKLIDNIAKRHTGEIELRALDSK